jgi:hypothetical protein
MWNLDFTPPTVIPARVLTRVPDSFRKAVRTDWCDANKPGSRIDCFLEGPTFDRTGNLYVCDIPFGRIFRITPKLEWQLVTQYDGWPNGLAIHRDGSLWIADYRRGLLKLDVSKAGAQPEAVLGHRNSESFRGLNDLTFDRERMLVPALSPEHHRAMNERTAGPVTKLVEMLAEKDPARLETFRSEYVALVTEYFSSNVVHCDFLMTRGIKR